jgi:hypothetical protein
VRALVERERVCKGKATACEVARACEGDGIRGRRCATRAREVRLVCARASEVERVCEGEATAACGIHGRGLSIALFDGRGGCVCALVSGIAPV